MLSKNTIIYVEENIKIYVKQVIVNLDKLTYAGNLENLIDIQEKDNYIFEKGDIQDSSFVEGLFKKYNFDGVIHLAAESHVDRSITNPMEFIYTNVVGTIVLLEATRKFWKNEYAEKLFYHTIIGKKENYRIRSYFYQEYTHHQV